MDIITEDDYYIDTGIDGHPICFGGIIQDKKTILTDLNGMSQTVRSLYVERKALLTKLEEKEREVEELKSNLEICHGNRAGLQIDFFKLKAENERLMGVVEKYAGCTEECANRQTSDGKALCDCGIAEALASLQKEKE